MSVHDFRPPVDFRHMRFVAMGDPAQPMRRVVESRDLWVDIVGRADLVADAERRIERALTRGTVPIFEMTDVELARQYFEAP
jgi:hypothetical protein